MEGVERAARDRNLPDPNKLDRAAMAGIEAWALSAADRASEHQLPAEVEVDS